MEKEYFELYKICIEQADKISERRMKCNHFFILINMAIVSLLSAFYTKQDVPQNIVLYVLVPICGIVICFFWHKMLSAYSSLNSAKFEIICDMEKQFDYQCFTKEWSILKENKKHTSLSTHEKRIPYSFAVAYILLLFVIFYVK